MKNPNKLLSKTPALVFAALFLLYGYDFITSFSYYNSLRYTRVNDYTWISLLLTAAIAISFLIVAIGCFIRKSGLQKAGFGLLAVFILCSIMNASNALAVNRILSDNKTPLFLSYCLSLARLAYALLLLMAIRIPGKSRMLGITAAGVYIVSFVYYLVAKGATPSAFGILNLLLWGSGAVLFGLMPYIQDHISENSVEAESQQTDVWICPECGAENKISRVNCSECGKQRD